MTTPEERARETIDKKLAESGWVVQSREDINLSAGSGVAIREFPMHGGRGYADYLLFVNGKAVGVLEAKAEGHTLSGVEIQANEYTGGFAYDVVEPVSPLPFRYVSTGTETIFWNNLDPMPRSRRVFQFHRPETIAEWIKAATLPAWVKDWSPTGEFYGGANERRYALDLPQVLAWIHDGLEPRTLVDASFSPIRLLMLRTRNSAAYKGLFALLMQLGSRDFLSGDTLELQDYFDLAIDIHHIFPRKWCLDRNLPEEKWNSVINKAPLASKTNRFIGGDAPSTYLERLQTVKAVNHDDLNAILETHAIRSGYVRIDNFHPFIRDRASRLLNLIETAMGKRIPGRDSDEVVAAFGGQLLNSEHELSN